MSPLHSFETILLSSFAPSSSLHFAERLMDFKKTLKSGKSGVVDIISKVTAIAFFQFLSDSKRSKRSKRREVLGSIWYFFIAPCCILQCLDLLIFSSVFMKLRVSCTWAGEHQWTAVNSTGIIAHRLHPWVQDADLTILTVAATFCQDCGVRQNWWPC